MMTSVLPDDVILLWGWKSAIFKEVMVKTQTTISCTISLQSSMLSVKNNLCLSGALRLPLEPTHWSMLLWLYPRQTDEYKLYGMGSNGPSVRLTLTVTSPCSSPASPFAWLHVHTSPIYQAIDFPVGPLVCPWLSPSPIRTSLFV